MYLIKYFFYTQNFYLYKPLTSHVAGVLLWGEGVILGFSEWGGTPKQLNFWGGRPPKKLNFWGAPPKNAPPPIKYPCKGLF